MTFEFWIAIIGIATAFLTHVVIFTIYITKLSSKIISCEQDIKVLHETDKLHSVDLKTLIKIEAQIELLIKHIIPNKQG
ncbi:MAG: hypothetical protein Q7S59_05845 [Sulfurimonas sp.]|nr:hypothetical protein [Sulfurimonas sp.]